MFFSDSLTVSVLFELLCTTDLQYTVGSTLGYCLFPVTLFPTPLDLFHSLKLILIYRQVINTVYIVGIYSTMMTPFNHIPYTFERDDRNVIKTFSLEKIFLIIFCFLSH